MYREIHKIIISQSLKFQQKFLMLYLKFWKATRNYRTYSISGKTVALVPEFAVEDLPSTELQPRFLHLQ